MLVLFDLPMNTKEYTKIYNQFRNNIIKDGFIMVQYSVYTRFCRNDGEYLKILKRVKKYIPEKGEVRILTVTEKQYQKMYLSSSKWKTDEELLTANPLVIIE